MVDFKNTDLWLTTLSEESEQRNPSSGARERLQNVFLTFRERARTLAAEINRDLPDFTVHDISHSDALWEMASLMAGSKFSLTPTEAFVLGGAFLIHDLGMGLAAYPGGIQTVKKDRGWNDSLTSAYKSVEGRYPTSEELANPPVEVEKMAVGDLLRNLHARRAEHLALASWNGSGEQDYHLIEDPELRRDLGPTIGRIAHSHWWSVDRLGQEFGTLPMGAPYGCPREWTIDSLKLACLLRVADASHLDSRRAPGFLRALRNPQGTAEQHWVFQEHLHQPQLREDRLVFTSGHRFRVEEAAAWWLCLDSLQLVDRELRQVDALLADTSRSRLAARNVAGAEEPSRLALLIPTDGWSPVDARIKVGNVAELVRRLGGEKLYGRDRTVPLRELIQNACDALRARRILEDKPEGWGQIIVRLGEDGAGHWLEVEDNGIGMSASVLTEALLNFGMSYWGSELMREELPGLLASGFQSTGKYGVGFFSVFMWGQHVRVSTRRPEVARRDTTILEFETGLDTRPILREATYEELMSDGGTRVRVWLKKSPYDAEGLLSRSPNENQWSLDALCGWLCPAIDANLFVEYDGTLPSRVVSAGDWKSIAGEDLLRRVAWPDSQARADTELGVLSSASRLRLVHSEDGTVIGRIAISPSFSYRAESTRPQEGVVTVGGMRSNVLTGVPGILVGSTERAARDIAYPVINSEGLSQWATEQADLLAKENASAEALESCAQVISALGGYPRHLPVARTAMGWLSPAEISEWTEPPGEILIVSDVSVSITERSHGEPLQLNSNVLVISGGYPGIFQTGMSSRGYEWPTRKGNEAIKSLQQVVVEALAEAWDSTYEEVAKGLIRSNERTMNYREVGTIKGDVSIKDNVDILVNSIVSSESDTHS